MLDKTMWNIFKETGNIYAYLYVNQHDKFYCIKEKNEKLPNRELSKIKETTIV